MHIHVTLYMYMYKRTFQRQDRKNWVCSFVPGCVLLKRKVKSGGDIVFLPNIIFFLCFETEFMIAMLVQKILQQNPPAKSPPGR